MIVLSCLCTSFIVVKESLWEKMEASYFGEMTVWFLPGQTFILG